ncbi:MAG TPA: magnesium/cobalt transporter CorA [Candidatus Heimdallarchaeota archaeon]|nr:magnesium/cobalt transporter CorA [Candidatus Heimdallarchaeota archaeon]
MARFIRRGGQKAGLSPGTIVHVGEVKTERVKISLVDYDESSFQEREASTIKECFPFKDKPTVTWINVDGLHEVEIVEALGKHFDLHPLVMEDIVHTGQRPKLEDYENTLFIVLKMLRYDEVQDQIDEEQFSLILGTNWVISFQEKEGDVFDPLRDRIRNSKGRIRKMGADYLAYTLVDAIVDNYFILLEKLGDRVEALGEKLVVHPGPKALQEIHELKREFLFLRKSVWPLREVISGLQRGESALFEEHTLIYLRDVYDHTIQVIDTVETFRDMISGMLDIYLSSVSNRMNEVMKVLTIIATIFIPLTFVAGIYGMNFQFMPELSWSWGYFGTLGVMGLAVVGMIIYFKRKKWL